MLLTFAACFLIALAPTASAQVYLAPATGTQINVTAVEQGNYTSFAFLYAATVSPDTIGFMISSQGPPLGCTETVVYGYGGNGAYIALNCNGGTVGYYTYTVRALSSAHGGNSATYTIHIY